MVTPAKPEALKRSRPASRMRSRVAIPVWLIAVYYSMTDRIFQNFDSGQSSAMAFVLQRNSSEPIGIESNDQHERSCYYHICMTEACLDPLLPENVGFRMD